MATLASLETDVAQFVTAMAHAKQNIATLNSIKKASFQPAQQANHTAVQPPSQSSHDQAENTATATTNGQTPAFIEAFDGEEQRVKFEGMRNQWKVWGKDVVGKIDAMLERSDVTLSERIALLGLLDRMAWYGVTSR